MTARLLIIGLDGADGRTLDRASRDGTLPNLAALRARGCAWSLSSAPGATDDALWASFQYGTEVGEHGRYSHQISSGYAVMDELDRETFWDKLSDRNLRVAIFDVPKCRPPRPLNGIHLADWLVHGRYFYSGPLAYPEELTKQILTRFGAAPPSRCDHQEVALSDDEVRVVRHNLCQAVAQKRAAGLHFLSTESWDLFAIGFKEAHCSSHMFWEFTDCEHAKYDRSRVERLGNPVLDVLKEQDAAIGDLVAAAGSDADVVVFSPTNFVPNGSILHLMPKIVKRVNSYIGISAGEQVRRALRRLTKRGSSPLARSVFYSDNAGAIHVPRRRKDTPESYMQRLDLIAALTRELVDVDDGLPVISAVTRPAFEFKGERSAGLPHLLLHFRSNVCPRAVTSARLGRIKSPRPDNIRTGNHAAGGFALAVGPWAGTAKAQVKSMKDFGALAEAVLTEHATGAL